MRHEPGRNLARESVRPADTSSLRPVCRRPAGIPAIAVVKATSEYGVSVTVFVSMAASPTLAMVTVTTPAAVVWMLVHITRRGGSALASPSISARSPQPAVDAD